MNVTEIVDELRATRPQASDALRLQVQALAARPPAATPSLFHRLRGRRRILVGLPAAAALAMVSAIAIGVSQPGSVQEAGSRSGDDQTFGNVPPQAAVGQPTESAADGNREALEAATTPGSPAVSPTLGRPQRYSAELQLEVRDADSLSDATQDALSIVRSLGGYAVSTSFGTSEQTGAAALVVRVPTAKVQDALVRLSGLGTIVGQQVQIDDLGDHVSTLEQRETTLREQIARLTARLQDDELAAEPRATLVARRASAHRELADVRAQAAAVDREATLATISLSLRTEDAAAIPATPSRFDRAVDRTVDILAWEAIAVLYVAVVAGPFVLLALVAWFLRRSQRRRDEDRLLAAS